MTKKHLTLSLLVLISLGSCQKNEIVKDDAKPSLSNKSANTATTTGVPTFPLDWENIDYMPTPAGSNLILVPWASGASRQISIEMANDYKKVDGWELVYNTFSSNNSLDRLYFVLYNKFRGIIRMYYYLPNTIGLTPSSNIAHKLGIEGTYGTSSPTMNFEAQEVIDYGSNSTFASTLEQWQVAPATWYAFEYELAYDPNLASQNVGDLNFIWPISTNLITQVNLNGNIDGKLNGSISTPGVDLSVVSNITTNNNSSINIKGGSDLEKVKPSIGAQLYSTVKGLLTKNITSQLGNLVQGLFNGIFGGKKDTNTDNVKLKLDAQISLQGNTTINTLMTSGAIKIPGYNFSNPAGHTPAYNEVLGVFYISNKPVVTETIYITPQRNAMGNMIPPKKEYIYTPKLSSFNLVINPAVLSVATIQNISYQMILEHSEHYEMVGGIEVIGTRKYVYGTSVGVLNNEGNMVGIRVMFDVVPNNGSPKSVMVKTFKANKETITIDKPEGGGDEW